MFTTENTKTELIYLSTGVGCYIHLLPTIIGTCPMFSIVYAANLFTPYVSKQSLVSYLKEFEATAKTSLCYLDIHEGFAVNLRKVIPECIIIDNPFRSSNGSDMVFFMLDLSKLKS